ncbi:hypothetical protein [Bacillus atrophaeus]|uniref:hypothetical protein n=1 Tax=Bacillus atrophaeus TaxID=1452 RepID=UPI002E1FA5CD|nr:hypothetical protein [Bacillus atrophaeus]
MSNEWLDKRAQLEKELLDAKRAVISYESTLKPYRTVTDSEYHEAQKAVINLNTAISEGDYDAARPADPYANMTVEELRSLYDEKKAGYKGSAGSGHLAAELMGIDTRIQRLQSEAAE